MLVTEKLDKPFEEIKASGFIIFTCDYCGKESNKKKHNYVTSHKTIKKDCCGHQMCINSKKKEVNLERFGFENPFSSSEVKEKIKQTNIEKYGVENPSQSPEIQDKMKQTCLERFGYGSALQSPEIQEKKKNTMVAKFGYEHALQSPEIQEKMKQTCLEKYGHEYYACSPEIQDKIKQTCLEKHGVKHTSQVPEIQEKRKQTCLKKYGHENPLQSPEIQDKAKQTCLERFGYESASSSPEVQEKVRQTNIERYGFPYPTHKYGKTQKEIQDWLNSFGFNFQSDHTVLGSKELDLYDSNLNFAIEYCGLYWHHENSPQPRPSNYHISKFNICKEKGIQLITIFEDEWLNNQEVIKSVILSKLGVFEKRLYARKCIAKEVSKKEFTDFCDKHHVQGGNSLAKVCFGLYYEDELIGVMDLGVHHRKQTKGEMVLTRLCFKAGYQIVGGASKLFSHCINWCKNNEIKKIISWSDSRWSNGSIYKNLNFKLEEELGSDYAYVNMSYPKERISKQSQMKCNTGCPKNISEKEWALQNGLSRIWDCGKVRWAFNV